MQQGWTPHIGPQTGVLSSVFFAAPFRLTALDSPPATFTGHLKGLDSLKCADHELSENGQESILPLTDPGAL